MRTGISGGRSGFTPRFPDGGERIRSARVCADARTPLGSHELAAGLKKLEAALTARLDVHETAIVDVLRRIME